MKKIKIILVFMLIVRFIFIPATHLYADETSELILKLLIKKGIVTQEEVDELRAEVSRAKSGIPETEDVGEHVKEVSWAEKIKLKGDIRLRNDYQTPGSGTYVNRQRIRARAAVEADILDNLKGGIGLATGGTDDTSGRSTNQNLQRVFSTKAFDLDLAYLTWKPYKFIGLTAGKYKNPLYRPGDLLWDSDIRFEGISTDMKYRILEDDYMPLDAMLNTGLFVLDDLTVDKKSPWLYVAQGGLGASFGDTVDAKVYFGYMDFVHIQNSKSTVLVPAAATANAEGSYNHDYDVIELSGDMTFHLLEGSLPKPFNVPVGLFGDYVFNTQSGDPDLAHGWQLGAKLGRNKFKKFGDWRAVYNFRKLEKDAFPEQFPDADSFRGRTDGFGHETIFSFGLAKNVWLEFDYYAFRDKTRGIDPNDKWGYIFQTDLNVKF